MVCSTCHRDLGLAHFSFKNKEKQIRKRTCKNCHSKYRRLHYLKNKQKYIDKAHKWNEKQSEILKLFLYKKLSEAKCIDCGEKDVLVLEFDHIENKKFGIAQMYKNKYSLEAVKKELEKCEIRCANCHRRKTAKDSNYWKFKMSKA